MKEPKAYRLSRYLRAKRSVDDRALNRRVWDAFIHGLVDRQSSDDELEILEVAGGIGSTAARVLDAISEVSPSRIHYTLVDIDPDLIEAAYEWLPKWGRAAGFAVRAVSGGLEFTSEEGTMSVELVDRDAFRVLDEADPRAYDAVIAQAWLDLVHVETALERIFRVLSVQGLFYAPIHFDGGTTFLPIEDEMLDWKISRLYHRSMDARDTPHGPAGGSRTGSQLLTTIPDLDARIVAAGASDWIVRPRSDGSYPDDEAYFLHHVLHFVEEELRDANRIQKERLDPWLKRRRAQIQSGELTYIAHQLDLLARKTQE